MIQTARYGPTAMPVDYAAYIMSASPPSAGLEFLSSSTFFDHLSSAERSFVTHAPVYIEQRKAKRTANLPKPIIIASPDSSDSWSGPSSPASKSPSTPVSPSRKRKSVTFADNHGYELATIRIMAEPSEIPPMMRPEVLSHLTNGTSASVTSVPPLALDFSQPAADYIAFRDRVEKNCVCLENVILRDFEIKGSIKVKNISFEKQVIVRYTFDSWKTSQDVDAVYSHGHGRSNYSDTFTFTINAPTDFDSKKQIQFCICYRPKGMPEYWDNNYDKNYTIVSSKQQEMSSVIDDFSNLAVDTSFACWKYIDSSVPYW